MKINQINKPRGTVDYFSQFDPSLEFLSSVCLMIAKLNGFHLVKTPVFEHQELFIRSIGDSSDIINKEIYSFIDKNKRLLALRPEMTASIMRASIENGYLNNQQLPLKCCYIDPMFRYERPQAGRQRQFYQFGIEILGSNTYFDDVDIIILATSILDAVKYKNYIIKINNICGFETRKKWIDNLKEYFTKFVDQLSIDSQKRLMTNPLRILDDKIDGEKDFVKKAPKISDFASDIELDYFKKLTNLLHTLKIKYVIDETLVRGLDYYSNFVFEVVSLSNKLIGQSTIIGGGRYNSLAKQLGNNEDINCVGFAIGLDRLIVALSDQDYFRNEIEKYNNLDVYIATLNEKCTPASIMIAKMLRLAGYSVSTNFNILKLNKHLRYALSCKVKYTIILGNNEMKDKKVTIKNLLTGKQDLILIDSIVDYLKNAH